MNKSSSEYIKKIAKSYSIYTCQNRAIPSVTDGLKDGQRKMLWTIRNKSEKVKTISLAGAAIQKGIYMHGDVSAANTISFLAAPYINNLPYLKGIGNFGTRVFPREIGAPRYTYVKKYKITESLIYPDLDIVPLKENYDGSVMEPITFLPIIPTVLLNGISGIAVGWSTCILPHKMDDLVDACLCVLNDKKIIPIVPHYSKYDLDIKNTGDNSWIMMGKIERVNTTTINVTELPPDLSLQRFKEHLNSLEDNNQIMRYMDKSAKDISVEIKINSFKLRQMSDDDILTLLKMKMKKIQRLVLVDWNKTSIKQYNSPEELIPEFVKWRLGWYRKRYQNKLQNAERDLLFQKALKECFDKKLPEKLQFLKNKKEVSLLIKKITKKYNLEEREIERITNTAIYKWTKETYNIIKLRIKELKDLVTLFKTYLGDVSELKTIYKKELLELKKIKL